MPLKSVGDAMHEFKAGDLHSGKGGPVVKSRQQAIAIGLSSERRAKRKASKSRAPAQSRPMSGGRY
jgi:hypothetical protein